MSEVFSVALGYLDTLLTAIVALLVAYFTHKSRTAEKESKKQAELRELLRQSEKKLADEREEAKNKLLLEIVDKVENVSGIGDLLKDSILELANDLKKTNRTLEHVGKLVTLATEFSLATSATIAAVGNVVTEIEGITPSAKEKIRNKIEYLQDSERALVTSISRSKVNNN